MFLLQGNATAPDMTVVCFTREGLYHLLKVHMLEILKTNYEVHE